MRGVPAHRRHPPPGRRFRVLVIADTHFDGLIPFMTSTQMKKPLRFGLAVLTGGIALCTAAPAGAQTGYSGPLYQEDAGTALSRHLRTLAEAPRNLGALTGAAKAALELGDAQAAATFYARAEEIAPRDGRIKAGLGSAFIAMEQPQAALKFFEDARSLGAPEGEFAADRGLAYDLLGNSPQAQRDYALAMRTNDSDELRRRMALSKAIGGDRAGALAAIDGQLRRQDRAAWRVRAFVLALTGDANGATDAVRAVMPSQAAAMQPFLTRLPTLRPADRAMAVHFGHFPGDGSPVQTANVVPQQYAGVSPTTMRGVTSPAPAPSASTALPPRRTLTPAPAPSFAARRQGYAPAEPSYGEERDLLRGGGTSRPRASQPVQSRVDPASREEPTRFAGSNSRATATSANRPTVSQSNDPLARASVAIRPAQTRVSPAAPNPAVATQRPVATPTPGPTQFADASAARPSIGPVQGPPAGSSPPVAVSPPAPQSAPANLLPNVAASASSAPIFTPAVPTTANAPALTSGGATHLLPPSVASSAQPQAPAVSAVTQPISSAGAAAATAPAVTGLSSGLADIAATIRALPSTEEEMKPESKPAVKRAEASPKPSAPAPKQVASAGPAPSRHWVQIASAPDQLTVSEYKRLKAKAPKLLSDSEAWKAPFRSTNRVLIGPFEDQKDAQSLVNALAKANIDAVPWTSAEGQEIVKLATK